MPEHKRSGYYTIENEEIIPSLIIKAAQFEAGRIKGELENRFENFAKARGYAKSASPASQPATTRPAAQPAAPTVRSVSSEVSEKKGEPETINGIPAAFWKAVAGA